MVLASGIGGMRRGKQTMSGALHIKASLIAFSLLGLVSRLPAQAPATRADPATDPRDFFQLVPALAASAENLVAAFSMDGPENAGLVFLQPGAKIRAHFDGPVTWVNDGGHQCADFAAPKCELNTNLTSAGLKNSYTLATWMKLPVPTGKCVIWEGLQQIGIEGENFVCRHGGNIQTFCRLWPFPTGWHHVAFTCEGHNTSFYLDGFLKGSIQMATDGNIKIIGGNINGGGSAGMGTQCDCLDDMLVFNRPLKPEEIRLLPAVRLPIHPPSPAEIAAAKRGFVPPTPPPGVPARNLIDHVSPEMEKESAEIIKDLGPLANNLLLALSMDNPDHGSAVVGPNGEFLAPRFEGPVQWVNDAGRQCASFAQRGAVLEANIPLPEREPYTIAAWMKLPVEGGHAVIFDSIQGAILGVKSGAFYCGRDADIKTFVTLHGMSAGWHHVAIVCNGLQSSFLFDGRAYATLPVLGFGKPMALTNIGNSLRVKPNGDRCDCLDDIFIYSRALTVEEIATLLNFRLPIHPPNRIPIPSLLPAREQQ